MAKKKRTTERQGKVYTRLIDTGIFRTYEKHCVLDDGTDIPSGKRPWQPLPLIRKGETLPHIEGEVQAALDDDGEFKGEAQDAAKMLEKLKVAMEGSDIGNVLYWGYFIGRAIERHSTRKHERNAKVGKDDQARRRKGGAATAKLTDEHKHRICDLMNKQIRGRVSKTAASKRVAGQLANEGISVSDRTVRDIYKAESENA